MSCYRFAKFPHKLLCGLLLFWLPITFAEEISNFAFVNEDASLKIDGRTIHLYGIHIPKTERTCRTSIRPMECGTRAAVALKFKIDGFVKCDIVEKRSDQTLVGLCRVNYSAFEAGDDLSAYLLEHGWAAALPDAPIEYKTLEKIARARGMGIWGFPIDNQ